MRQILILVLLALGLLSIPRVNAQDADKFDIMTVASASVTSLSPRTAPVGTSVRVIIRVDMGAFMVDHVQFGHGVAHPWSGTITNKQMLLDVIVPEFAETGEVLVVGKFIGKRDIAVEVSAGRFEVRR